MLRMNTTASPAARNFFHPPPITTPTTTPTPTRTTTTTTTTTLTTATAADAAAAAAATVAALNRIDLDAKETKSLFEHDNKHDPEDGHTTTLTSYLDEFLAHLSLLHCKPLLEEAGIHHLGQFLMMTETDLGAILGKDNAGDVYLLSSCIDILRNHHTITDIHRHSPENHPQEEEEEEEEEGEQEQEEEQPQEETLHADENDKEALLYQEDHHDTLTQPSKAMIAFNAYITLNKKQQQPSVTFRLETSTPSTQANHIEPILLRRRKNFRQIEDHHESSNSSSSSSSSSSSKDRGHSSRTSLGCNPLYFSNFNQRPLSMPLPLPSYIVTPPPDYMMTPTALLGKKLDRCRSMLVASTPREEDGKEDLPDYSCTVYKMGYVYIKKEYDMPHVKAKWRRWRKLYVELWGTVLKLYRTAPKATQQESTTTTTAMEHYPWLFRLPYQYYYKYYYCPIVSISLAGAEAARALDYFRRPNVLRLTTQQGPQLLMKLPSHVDMISWIEHLQAAINISLDLEQRPMPKFITIQTRGLASNIPDSRAIALERAREQRRRDQHEVLI